MGSFESLSRLTKEEFLEFNFDIPLAWGDFRYYLDKLVNRVNSERLYAGKTGDALDVLVRRFLIWKYKQSCSRYFSTEYYTERDESDDGDHLLVICECYEWMLMYLGVSKEFLIDTRLIVDCKLTDSLFANIEEGSEE